MLSHLPRSPHLPKERSRIDTLLYFLVKYCSALKKELDDSGLNILRAKWSPLVDDLTDMQLGVGCNYIKIHEESFITPQRFNFISHGLIDPSLAYEQAVDKIYNHPAVYHAASRADLGRNICTEEQGHIKFKNAYNFMCEKVLNGEILSPAPLQVKSKGLFYQREKYIALTPQQKKLADKELSKIYNILKKAPFRRKIIMNDLTFNELCNMLYRYFEIRKNQAYLKKDMRIDRVQKRIICRKPHEDTIKQIVPKKWLVFVDFDSADFRMAESLDNN